MKCQYCGATITAATIDSLTTEYVAHTYPAGDGSRQATDYYCGPRCFVEAHNE